MQMPLDLRGAGPTNGTGNWQKGIRSDLPAWQTYYWRLAHQTNQVTRNTAAEVAFRKRYGLPPLSDPPTNRPEAHVFPVPTVPQKPAEDVMLALSIYDQTIEELRE